MNQQIDAESLRTLLSANNPPNLVHVLPEEDFTEAHLPGAHNFCAYETAFVGKIAEAFPDRSTSLVVYGLSGETREGEMAAQKLRAAGYTNVAHLDGGLAAWRASGGSVEGTGSQKPPTISETFALDLARSVIHWTGRNLFNSHHGTLKLSGGSAEIRNDALVSARLTIDLASIDCTDLADSALKKMLQDHLLSDDFFAADRFPAPEFIIESATPLSGSTAGIENFLIRGHLTLRGDSHPIAFPAQIARADDGTLTGQAQFTFDRTRWGAIYGSGKFFARLAQHVVNDDVHLYLRLHFLPVS